MCFTKRRVTEINYCFIIIVVVVLFAIVIDSVFDVMNAKAALQVPLVVTWLTVYR